jgi:hypothetical protein
MARNPMALLFGQSRSAVGICGSDRLSTLESGALQSPPYLKGVGTALLVFAKQRSLALGYDGLVGLHSLPISEGFYRRLRMSDYGEDPDKDNLRYFEFDTLE